MWQLSTDCASFNSLRFYKSFVRFDREYFQFENSASKLKLSIVSSSPSNHRLYIESVVSKLLAALRLAWMAALAALVIFRARSTSWTQFTRVYPALFGAHSDFALAISQLIDLLPWYCLIFQSLRSQLPPIFKHTWFAIFLAQIIRFRNRTLCSSFSS